ncbi:hypothetical protein CsSME_00015419 [Camellia sinensis var. sinensis]
MAANSNRVGVLFVLLVCGVFLLGEKPELANAKFCPEDCRKADYMKCKSSGEKRLSPACNCCFAGKGCTIYYCDGTSHIC